MFKGIAIARQQQLAADSVKEFDAEAALETIMGLEDMYQADRAAAERAETLKNARALRSALEQFGSDASATRALLAFADADGQLSAAFGIKHEGALESVDDTQILVDAATIAGGLESYIVGEEQVEASMEGFMDWVRRHKVLTGVLLTLFAPFGIFFGAPAMIALKIMDDNAKVPATFSEVKGAYTKISEQLSVLSKIATMSPASVKKAEIDVAVASIGKPTFTESRFAAAGWKNDSIKEIVTLANKAHAEATSVLKTVSSRVEDLTKGDKPGDKMIVAGVFEAEKAIKESISATRAVVKAVAAKCYSKKKPVVEE